MTKYFTLLTSSDQIAPPDVGFEKLLKFYLNESKSLFSKRHHQFFVVKLLRLISDFRTQNVDNINVSLEELWASITNYLNNNLPLHRLDKKGDFALLLNTFFSFYPNLTALLHADLYSYLSSSPYLFSAAKEIKQLLNHLCLHRDDTGIVGKTFANLLLKSPPAFREDLFIELGSHLGQHTLEIKLQLAEVLSSVRPILPDNLIREIIDQLIVHMNMEPHQIKAIAKFLSEFAPHLNAPVQKIFIFFYLKNVEAYGVDNFKTMLFYLRRVIPYLALENIQLLIEPFLKLMQKYQTSLATDLCETFATIYHVESGLMENVIKDYINFQNYYEKDVFLNFDKLSANFTPAKKVEFIRYLCIIYLTRQFLPPNSSWYYTAESYNKKTCLESIKKLFMALDEATQVEIIETNLMDTTIGAEYFDFWSGLVGERQIVALHSIVDHLTESLRTNSCEDSYATKIKLSKALLLALKNQQSDIVKDFLNRLNLPSSANDRSALDYLSFVLNSLDKIFIIYMIQDYLYNHLDQPLKNLFHAKIRELFALLSKVDQYKIIERFAYSTDPELIAKYVEDIRPSLIFDLDAVTELSFSGFAFLQNVLNPQQNKTVLTQLSNAFPKRHNYPDNYPDMLAKHLYTMSLYVDNLNQHARVEILKRLIKEGIRVDNNRGFRLDDSYVGAVARCVNIMSETDIPEMVNIIKPFLLIEDEYIQNSKFPLQLLKAISSKAQASIAQNLLEITPDNQSVEMRKLVFSLFLELLALLPESTHFHKFILNRLISELPHVQMKEDFKLRRKFNDLLEILPATSTHLSEILFALCIYNPNLFHRSEYSRYARLAHATKDNTLIRAIIRINIHTLSRLSNFCNSLDDLCLLADHLTVDHKLQIAETLTGFFENDTSIERNPISLDTSILQFNHVTKRLFISNYFDLMPGLVRDIISKLITKNTLGSQRILARLQPEYNKIFDEIAIIHLTTWFTNADPTLKSNSLEMLKKILKVIDINVSVVVEAVKDISDLTKQIIILQLAHYMKNDTPAIQAFSKNALFDLFDLWGIPFKQMILNKLMTMVLSKNFVNTNNLSQCFQRMTQQIAVMKDAKQFILSIKDCYSTKLMSTPSHHYDDGRKLLLYMISTVNYSIAVRPLLNKKTHNVDLDSYIMSFLI